MPEHDKYPFSVWLQHDTEQVEEFDLQYSKDRRIVTCWVSEDLIQSSRRVYWRSNGLGHPSKVRIFTERERVVSQKIRDSGLGSTCSRSAVSMSYERHNPRTENAYPQTYCDECEALTTDGRILTIRVEVLMPSEMRPPQYASGSLPLRKDSDEPSRCYFVKNDPFSPGMRGRPLSPSYPSCRQPVSFLRPPSFEISNPPFPTFDPSPSCLIFYFRARPRGILRPCSFPSRKRARSPFILGYPQPACSTLETKRRKSSRSDFSSSVSEDSTKVGWGSPTMPTLGLPNPSSVEAQARVDAPSNPSRKYASLNPHWRKTERGSDGRPRERALKLAMDVGVQTDPMSNSRSNEHDHDSEIQRQNWRAYDSDCERDDELDQLLVKVERSLLETHRMLLDLRKKVAKPLRLIVLPLHKNYNVWLECDGKKLEEYEVETDGTTVSCWIASEIGKTFRIQWRDLHDLISVSSELTFKVDGIEVVRSIAKRNKYTMHGIRVDEKTVKPLVFATIALTDDETVTSTDYGRSRHDLGIISVAVQQVIVTDIHSGQPTSSDVPVLSDSPWNEKEAKARIHRVAIGLEVERRRKWKTVRTKPFDKDHPGPVAIFNFKYRPEAFLRAQGIIAPARLPCENKPEMSGDTGVMSTPEPSNSQDVPLHTAASDSRPPKRRVKSEEQETDNMGRSLDSEEDDEGTELLRRLEHWQKQQAEIQKELSATMDTKNVKDIDALVKRLQYWQTRQEEAQKKQAEMLEEVKISRKSTLKRVKHRHDTERKIKQEAGVGSGIIETSND